MVIEYPALEDELGDVLEKAMHHAGLSVTTLAQKAQLPPEKITEAFGYRYAFDAREISRLAAALRLNEVGLAALAQGRYPLPAISELPFCLYPLRTPHGIGVANAYIVEDCGSGEGILIDTARELPLLRRVWPRKIHKIAAIFITHVETEHTGALSALAAEIGPVPVYCPAGMLIAGAQPLAEGQRISYAGFEISALHTPGHAEAHNCYQVVNSASGRAAPPVLFSGDLLFAGSVGGAYFCRRRLSASLRRLWSDFPEETVVAPGHGPLTTLGNERRFNPFIV